jgi:hypothetical protein
MRLILFMSMVAGGWAQPTVEIHHVTGRASNRLTEAERYLRTARHASWRGIETPEEEDVVSAVTELYRGLFRPELGSAPKIVTLTDKGQDILVALWTAKDSQGWFSELIVWDTPNQTSFIFRLPRGSWSNDAQIRSSFERLLLPPPADGGTPPAKGVTVNVAKDAYTGRWIGAGGFPNKSVPRQIDVGPLNWFDLLQSADGSYLAAGFSQFDTPGRSIPERFPPLESRLGKWPTQRILDELGHGGFAAAPRDRILAKELMRRPVTDEELLEVLKRRKTDVSGALLYVIVEEHQVAHFEGAIRRYLQADRGCGQCNEPFTILSRCGEVNFTDVALEVLRLGNVTYAPFTYVSDHGTTAADYNALQELRPSYPFGHEYLLERMRRRLGLAEDGTPKPAK